MWYEDDAVGLTMTRDTTLSANPLPLSCLSAWAQSCEIFEESRIFKSSGREEVWV